MTIKSPLTGSSAQPPSAAVQAVAVVGPLSMSIPDGRSDQYASGWACADAIIAQGTGQGAAAGADWAEKKAQGFWDRLKAERERKSATLPVAAQ